MTTWISSTPRPVAATRTRDSSDSIGCQEYENRLRVSRVALAVASVLLVFAATAVASTAPSVAWSKKDMTTALKRLGYPKPHAKKLTCKGPSTATSFRCLATYRSGSHRRFVAGGVALGGWICAGKSLAACATLRHGFVTNRQLVANDNGDLAAAAEFASRGYLQVRDGVVTTYPKGSCTKTGLAAWSCPYNWTNNSTITVTVTFKKAKGGYVTSAAQS